MSYEADMRHQKVVAALAKPGSSILADLTPNSSHLLHMAVGVAGEAGELLDAIKKHAIYTKPLDMQNVIEELGDLEFYMEGIRASLNISRDDVIEYNMEKLGKRYPEWEYTNSAAQERADKNA